MLSLVIGIIFLALLFDFQNGRADAANSIATVVSTGVLPPRYAVLWAAFFNFIAAFLFGVHVANTIGTEVIDPEVVSNGLLIATLVGSVSWSFICVHLGIPISISHSLIGGLSGTALVKAGVGALKLYGIGKIVVFIFVAPIFGLLFGFFVMTLVMWIFRKKSPRRVDKIFRVGQLVSCAAFSLGHGANDAQKTMGIIALVLYRNGFYETFTIPFWVVIACHASIALGTAFGGWRVVETMGMRLTRLRPVGGFSAETAGAIALFGTSLAGIPVSTTHTISGAIMGVGATRRLSAVRWGVSTKIFLAWILTIPFSALLSGCLYWVFITFGPSFLK